ncbi:ABC transporter substrate-binding protein [Mesorhizobium sp. L-8-3]|uniref:ABC transporter substrate-binding protein n=1 Tax=Mesorhizobium sp. L-8-3 TaxID=2744522 RepID=UPI00192760F6|nr:ABC transporter substrate-binding protein [Mesorhizobium sp. L-8-3]BCH20398.1 cobalamin ABC transporter substrate-binding protein [Mesorhizobium sp. L-8-3]
MRHLELMVRVAACAAAFFAVSPAVAGEGPKRVVSMNVCTDQLAMLVAGERQLLSVSYLASDPSTSVLAEEAGRYRVNHGLAEEIFLLHPDLVIAGTYTTRTTVELLRRLGIRVEEFAPESSIDDIRASLMRMGDLLGRPEHAAELVAELDRGLAALAADRPPERTVALYYANSYMSGAGTLVDAVVDAAGLVNIADRLGIVGTVELPLELLVLAAPDMVVGDEARYAKPALAQEIFMHPAFKALLSKARPVVVPSAYTICGTPFTLEAARILQRAAREPAGALR